MNRSFFDRYDTLMVAINALLEQCPEIRGQILLDPCAGDGRMAKRFLAAERFKTARENDLDPSIPIMTHLDARDPALYNPLPCWVVTNPPFRAASEIAQVAITHSKIGVALLLRCTFLEPCQNRLWLAEHPPTCILSLPRLSFIQNGKKDSVPTWWFVWIHGQKGSIHVVAPKQDLLSLAFPQNCAIPSLETSLYQELR